jgi:two-component system, OmpR family, phosphate regulon response regulator PhoB
MGEILIAVAGSVRCSIESALAPHFPLRQCADLAAARAGIARSRPDLVLLDLAPGETDGLALCSELRADDATRTLPVIFVAVQSPIETKVRAFAAGADDFVEAPFHAAELCARVSARIRRGLALDQDGAVRALGPLRIDRDRFKAHLLEDGTRRDLDLTAHELRLLGALADAPGRVLSRGQLARVLVGDCVITERTIDTHLCNLRRKLGPMRAWIETVRGVGYRLNQPAG